MLLLTVSTCAPAAVPLPLPPPPPVGHVTAPQRRGSVEWDTPLMSVFFAPVRAGRGYIILLTSWVEQLWYGTITIATTAVACEKQARQSDVQFALTGVFFCCCKNTAHCDWHNQQSLQLLMSDECGNSNNLGCLKWGFFPGRKLIIETLVCLHNHGLRT